MQLPVLLIIASLVPLSPAMSHNHGSHLGGQLKNFDAIYSNLTLGLRVRYFIDLPSCQLVAGKQYPAHGGDIYSYTGTVKAEGSTSFISFSTQTLNYGPQITTTLTENLVYSEGNVRVIVTTLDPATYHVIDSSLFICGINDGTTGSAYFHASNPSPPSLLASYGDITGELLSGSVVLYSVQYMNCHPAPVINMTRGGTITPYQAINSASSNPGLQYSNVRSTPVGYDTMVMSFFQNGSVNLDIRAFNDKYQPVVAQYISCTMNDGKNNGGVSFY